MAERSFAREVQQLRLGAGAEFRGEGILAITKALLENGVGYVAGYQGAPISHLMDVLADASDILAELGVHFESSANEAAAAATLATSVMYPIRGAVTFKSTAGTNVASDALSNLSSSGVTGGALIILGEDYGEGSSIMQERSHAFAMKSQLWLLDPRPNLPSIVRAVEHGFALSEASSTPVMLEVRIRACHVHGSFIAKDNRPPPFSLTEARNAPRRDTGRIVLPPASFAHERDKIARRWPAAVDYIQAHGLNEFFDGDLADVGIILQGGMYNGVMRALMRMGLADIWGTTRVPLYVLNVTYPLVDAEVVRFCSGKRAVLVVEEGQPDFIEQALVAHPARGRPADPPAGQARAADGRRIHRRGAGRRRARVHDRRRIGRRTDPARQRRRRAGRGTGPRAGARGARSSAWLLHRVSGAADFLRHEAGRAGTGPASHRGGYRLPSVLDPAAVQRSARRRWGMGWDRPRRPR